MSNNPFKTDYAGTAPTQTVSLLLAANAVEATTTSIDKSAEVVPVEAVIERGFKITPIPTVSGKPKRLIIRGKVTSD